MRSEREPLRPGTGRPNGVGSGGVLDAAAGVVPPAGEPAAGSSLRRLGL